MFTHTGDSETYALRGLWSCVSKECLVSVSPRYHQLEQLRRRHRPRARVGGQPTDLNRSIRVYILDARNLFREAQK